MSVSTKLKGFLDQNHVPYLMVLHTRAYTAQETAASIHVPGKELAKSVIVRADDHLEMVVLPATQRVDLEKLRKVIGASEIRLAVEEEFRRVFPDCEPGAEPPFGNLYGLQVTVDDHLAEDPEIVFNAGSHTEAVRMRFKDYSRLVQPRVAQVARAHA